MSKSIQTVETEHHVIEIESTDYKRIKRFCKKLGITIDYYFFEFQYYDDEELED